MCYGVCFEMCEGNKTPCALQKGHLVKPPGRFTPPKASWGENIHFAPSGGLNLHSALSKQKRAKHKHFFLLPYTTHNKQSLLPSSWIYTFPLTLCILYIPCLEIHERISYPFGSVSCPQRFYSVPFFCLSVYNIISSFKMQTAASI